MLVGQFPSDRAGSQRKFFPGWRADGVGRRVESDEKGKFLLPFRKAHYIIAAGWISFLLVGSGNYSSHNLKFGFLVLGLTIAYSLLFNIATIILRPNKYNIMNRSWDSHKYKFNIFSLFVKRVFPIFILEQFVVK